MESQSPITKWTSLGAALLAAAFALFLFSRSGIAREARPRTENGRAKTALHVWDWWSPATDEKYGTYFAEVKRDFEKLHPDVEVIFQYVPFSQYEQKMATALVGNSPPDVFQSSVYWAEGFYDRGMLMPLNAFIESPEMAKRPAEEQVNKEAFLESAWQHNVKLDGTVFGVPQALDAEALVWNLKILKEAAQTDSEIRGMFAQNADGSPNYAHLKPDGIKDWEAFRRITKRLTQTDSQGTVTRAGFALQAYGTGAGPFMSWCAANGSNFQDADGKQALFSNPAGLEAIQFVLDLYWKDRISFAFRRQLSTDEVFNQGASACVSSGTWAGKYIRRNTEGKMAFDMTPFPPGPHGDKPATLTWGNMLVIPKRCAQPSLAWEYIRFISSKNGNLRLLRHLGQNSPRKDFYASSEWDEMCRRYPDLINIPAICKSGKKLRHTQINAVDYASQPIFETLLLHAPEIAQGKGAYPSIQAGVERAASAVNRVYARYQGQRDQWKQSGATR